MDSNPQTINCNRCRKSRKSATVSALCPLGPLSALAALLDRVGIPGPRGTARYHTFVIHVDLQNQMVDVGYEYSQYSAATVRLTYIYGTTEYDWVQFRTDCETYAGAGLLASCLRCQSCCLLYACLVLALCLFYGCFMFASRLLYACFMLSSCSPPFSPASKDSIARES